jgi:hypothetical protein
MRTSALGLSVLLAIGVAGCDGGSSSGPSKVCTYAISPATHDFDGNGGTATVAVTTDAQCAWTAAADAAWIAVTSGATGTGPGNVSYQVGPNAAASARSGTVTVAGRAHAVTQQGRPATACSYRLSPGSADYGKDGGDGAFAVVADAGCAWTATGHEAWLEVTSGASGTGNGTVEYRVSKHSDTAERTGSIAVADQTFTVRQQADTGACAYSVAPVDFDPCMPGGTLTTEIRTAQNCPWTVSAGAPWLSVNRTSGSGSASILISVPANYDARRSGTVMVRWMTPTQGQNVHVDQAGCRYGTSTSALSFPAAGGPGAFDVLQQSDPIECGGPLQDACLWTAAPTASWITITSSMPKRGDDSVHFTVATNTGSARTASITVRDRVVTIAQAGP